MTRTAITPRPAEPRLALVAPQGPTTVAGVCAEGTIYCAMPKAITATLGSAIRGLVSLPELGTSDSRFGREQWHSYKRSENSAGLAGGVQM